MVKTKSKSKTAVIAGVTLLAIAGAAYAAAGMLGNVGFREMSATCYDVMEAK